MNMKQRSVLYQAEAAELCSLMARVRNDLLRGSFVASLMLNVLLMMMMMMLWM